MRLLWLVWRSVGSQLCERGFELHGPMVNISTDGAGGWGPEWFDRGWRWVCRFGTSLHGAAG